MVLENSGRRLWYDADAPVVSVIIPNFKSFEHLAGCLDSIWEHTEGYTYEIIIVDNGSGPDELAAIETLGDKYRLIPLRENHFFGDSCNLGALEAKGMYLAFLNNDCRATPNWLPPLITTLEHQALCGGVGPKFLFPDGRLQEVGAFLRDDGWTIQVGRNDQPFDPEVIRVTHVVDYCSAACFVMTRKLFIALRGFDPIFSPAYHDDVDLALRIAEAGLFVYCCPQSTVLHYLNSTSHRIWSEEQLSRLSGRNVELFRGRWRNRLRRLGNANSACDKHSETEQVSSHAPRPAAQEAFAPAHIEVLRDLAQLDLRRGYFHAALSSTAGELEGCRAAQQQNALDLHTVRLARGRPINADRADLRERESELEASAIQLSARMDSLQTKMQKDLATWRDARAEFEQRSKEVGGSLR